MTLSIFHMDSFYTSADIYSIIPALAKCRKLQIEKLSWSRCIKVVSAACHSAHHHHHTPHCTLGTLGAGLAPGAQNTNQKLGQSHISPICHENQELWNYHLIESNIKYFCSEVKGLVWVVNKGQLLSMCGDDTLYLLDVKTREVEIVQLIKFNKERLTALNLAVNSNWVFVGTDRGNTHVVRLGEQIPVLTVS